MMNVPVSLGPHAQADKTSTYVGMQRAAEKLQVRNVMTRQVVTIGPADTLQAAAELMSKHHVSCLLVVDRDRFQGILTQRDVLLRSAEATGGPSSAAAGQRVRPDVPTVAPETGILEAGQIMETERTKWLPVLAAGRLEGIVTQTDVIGAVTSMVEVVEVDAVMNADVTTVDAATTVRQATEIMTGQGISCVVAVHGGKMVGILTEKDILKRVCAAGRDPGQVLVADIMSFPVTTIQPCYCLFTAHRKMDRMHIHRLVVMDEDRLVGIITQTDILRNLKETLFRHQTVP